MDNGGLGKVGYSGRLSIPCHMRHPPALDHWRNPRTLVVRIVLLRAIFTRGLEVAGWRGGRCWWQCYDLRGWQGIPVAHGGGHVSGERRGASPPVITDRLCYYQLRLCL